MGFEPQKFFIGLIDFFSILLPGALVTYLVKDEPRLEFLGVHRSGATGWVIFGFSAYLLGHFVFLLGAWLLDDYFYDPIRTATCAGIVGRLAGGRKLPWKLTRFLANVFVKKDKDLAVRHATRIKEHHLEPGNASAAVNTFQWCKARLAFGHPEALASVNRFEADSKFFRSICIILVLFVPWMLIERRFLIGTLSAALLILAFWRYVDQRVKATTQAYWYIITLEGQREDGYRKPLAEAVELTHAGGVVFKMNSGYAEYLLVQAKNSPQEWVLPKGHIECGENSKETAVREVQEETGVWAYIDSKLDDISYRVSGERINVRFFLMEALEQGQPMDHDRKHEWLKLKEAIALATHEQSQALLEIAEKRRLRNS
jgi:ADP-ribose pyrophosphatase YjhB (NUDIX family)